jgi:TRAP-type mannitol/chloroaromatic compound transport system permease small subunit
MSYERDADLESQAQGGPPASPFGRLVDGLNGAGSALIFAIMLLVVADVLARDLFSRPIDGVAELVAMSIVAIVFLQLGSTLRHGRMSRADLFIDGFRLRRPRAGSALQALFDLCGVAVCAIVGWASWPLLVKAWNGGEYVGIEGVFTAPTWPVKAIVVAGCAVTAIQYLLHALAAMRAALSPASEPGAARSGEASR